MARDDLEARVELRTRELASAKARAQEDEARLRAIIEHAADGIITANDQGRIEVINLSAAKISSGTSEVSSRGRGSHGSWGTP